MRRGSIIHIILACVCLLLLSCDNHKYPVVLVQVDSLIEVKPDSAVSLLQSLDAQMRQVPEETRMYYRLLKIKAADKAYIPHKSDKEILQIVAYYEHKGDKAMLPWAYYYAGCVCRDLNDAEKSLDYYHKALNSTDDVHVKGLCSVAIGYIFRDREMFDLAGEFFLSSYRYDKMRNDVNGMIFDLRDIGRNYWDQRNCDSASIYLSEGLRLAEKYNNKEMASSINLQLAVINLQQNQNQKAKDCLDACLANLDSCEFFTYQSVLASYYVNTGEKDSASVCFLRAFSSDNIYTKQKASAFLADYYADLGETSRADYFLSKNDSLKNQVSKTQKTEKLLFKQYHYDNVKRHNVSLLNLLLFVSVLIVFIVLVSLFVWYVKKRHTVSKAISQPCDDAKDLKPVSKNILQRCDAAKEVDLVPEWLKHIIHNKAVDTIHISNEEWEEFKNRVENEYPNFRNVLLAQCNVSETEYRICLLIRVDVPVTIIGKILNMTTQNVSNARKRLIEKINGAGSSAKDCDAWIKSL